VGAALDDRLCEAALALEARDAVRAPRLLDRAIARLEAAWLAVPPERPVAASRPA
jgi:hypothetical protein